MVKRILMVLSLIAVLGFCGSSLIWAQAVSDTGVLTDTEAAEATIKGVISEVAEDGSTLVINNETLTIDQELRDYMNIEAGDSVELTVKTVDGKKVVVDFDYVESE
ncbi:MAG: hypothetical protein V1747_08275 [Candidatus Omnitrophota bacterium]